MKGRIDGMRVSGLYIKILLILSLMISGCLLPKLPQSNKLNGGTKSDGQISSEKLSMGSVRYFTENDRFEIIEAEAQKENKPILMFLSFGHCPCGEELQTRILQNQEFSEIARNFVMVLVRNKNERVMEWLKRFSILEVPLFVLLSPDGELIDQIPGWKSSTISDFNESLDFSLSLYDLEKLAERKPSNKKIRECWLDKVKKGFNNHGLSDAKLMVVYKKLLGTNDTMNEPEAHEISELLALIAITTASRMNETAKELFLEEYRAIVTSVFEQYYPDKFAYVLKNDSGFYWFMRWFDDQHNYNMVDAVYQQGVQHCQGEDKFLLNLHDYYVSFLIEQERYQEAEKLIREIIKIAGPYAQDWKRGDYSIYFPRNFLNALFVKKPAELLSVLKELIEFYLESDMTLHFEDDALVYYAAEHDLYVSELLERFERSIDQEKIITQAINLLYPKTVLFNKLQGSQATTEMLLNLEKDNKFNTLVMDCEKGDSFPGKLYLMKTILWNATELQLVDDRFLIMAEELSDCIEAMPETARKDYLFIQNLAYQYYAKGEREKAIDLLRYTIKMTDRGVHYSDSFRQFVEKGMKERLKEWLSESGSDVLSPEDDKLINEIRCQ